MNQRFSSLCIICRSSSSLLRKNPSTRLSSSSKPIFSSSSNIMKVFISKLHHGTFNYPSPSPKIPGNHHVRKFSGEAAKCDFRDDDYFKNEILKLQDQQYDIPWSIEFGCGPFPYALDDLVDKFNALMEKLGLATLDSNEKEAADYPHHLRNSEKRYKVESVDMTVAFGEFVEAGGDSRWTHFESNYECMLKYHEILASLKKMKIRSRLMRQLVGYPSPPQIPGNHHFRKFSEGAAGWNFGDDDDLKKEIWKIEAVQMGAQGDIEMGNGPPLDAVKVLADKFDALMENLGLETLGDYYPDHLKRFRDDFGYLEKYADMTIAFGEYVAAGGNRSWQPFMGNYRCMINYEKILASLRQMKVRSKLMRRLIKAESDSESKVAHEVVKWTTNSVI